MKWWNMWLQLKEEIDARMKEIGLSFDLDITNAVHSFCRTVKLICHLGPKAT